MTTTYTNSVSYLNSQQWLDAEELGYINSVLYGVSPMGMIPIVPASSFMKDEYMLAVNDGTKNTQKRRLNEVPDAKQSANFKKATEYTGNYLRRTDIDTKLANRSPHLYDAMLMADAKKLKQDMDWAIFNEVPDGNGEGLQGLAARIPIGASNYYVDNSATLNPATSATTMKTFLQLFRAGVDMLKLEEGTQVVCFTNRRMKRAITAGRDQLGANVVGFGTMDILNKRVATIDEIPMLTLEADTIGQPILPFTESSENSCSLWLAQISQGSLEGSFEQPNGLTIISTDMVITKETATVLKQIQTAQEMDIGLKVPDASLVRFGRLLAP